MGSCGSHNKYFDWARAFSFNADVTMIIAARGRGKTYGLRRQCLLDSIRKDFRFVEIARHKDELPELMAGYFEKLALEDTFDEYEFKVEGKRGYWRIRDDEDKRWRCACYFVAMTEAQKAKKRTYVRVKRIIFDEGLIDSDPYHRYLPRELSVLANIVDTVTRERGDEGGLRPHLYICANACDLINPYFTAWGIDRVPPFGESWHAGHTVLLIYEDPKEYAVEKAERTLAGRMVNGTDEGAVAILNEFALGTDDDIAEKPSSAQFWIGVIYMGERFGVWIDWDEGFYYVNRRIPKNAGTVYSLTRRDNTANRLVAQRASKPLQVLASGHYSRIIRYDSPATREKLLDALSMFGIR